MHELAHKAIACRAITTLVVAIGLSTAIRGEEPISFVLPVARFQTVPPDAYPESSARLDPPIPPQAPLLPPQNEPAPGELVVPDQSEYEQPYSPAPVYEPTECTTCNSNGSYLPPGRMPNGQYPDNWMWGCGGWPYANGPGACDDWQVGCKWHVTADGIIIHRPNANLNALRDATNFTSLLDPQGPPEVFDQFDYGPGGRVFFTSEIPHRAGYQVQAGYEGVDEWNASIVYPRFPEFGPLWEQRSVSYKSSMHSAELNFLRRFCGNWRPFCGVRYVKFDDEINDTINQEGPGATDRIDTLDLENNLIGFQIGSRHELWHPVDRVSLEGFVNAGVYYNHIRRTDLLRTITETSFTRVNNVSEPSEMATLGEISLTGVFRLNRCWALRAGYAAMWIDGLSLAEDAFLNTGVDTRDLFFHGLHMGVECRR